MGNQGLGQLVSWYVCTIAVIPFVGLRLYMRLRRFGKLALDDYFIILALCCLIGDLGIQHHMWNLGLGDMSIVTPENFKGIMKMIVPGSVLYVSSLWCIKFSLVLLYRHFPSPGSRLILIYNIALGGLAVTFLTIFFDILFQCYPYDKRWSLDPNYQCDPKAAEANYWITILFNIFSDAIIICLPISMVMKLQLKLKQKLGIAAMFALGFFVVISSIVRAYYSHRNETMLTCTVSMVENAIAIIAACLPALRTIILGHTTNNNTGSYGKHYELSSGHKMAGKNRTATSTVGGGVPFQQSKVRDPNGSENSLVSSKADSDRGIRVQTTIETMLQEPGGGPERGRTREREIEPC